MKPEERSKPGVYAPHATVLGKSLAQWSADWWSKMLSIQTPHNPLLDTTGADAGLGDTGKIFFLAGVGFNAPTTVTRNIKVKAGEPIFFPVINAYADNSNYPTFTTFTETELRGFAAQLVGADATPPNNVLSASVDGKLIGGLLSHRELSPTVSYTLPDTHNLYEDVYGLPITGKVTGAVSDGYWVMLKAMEPGRHVIHFGGSVPGAFSLDVTYNITIVPGGHGDDQTSGCPITAGHDSSEETAGGDSLIAALKKSHDLLGV